MTSSSSLSILPPLRDEEDAQVAFEILLKKEGDELEPSTSSTSEVLPTSSTSFFKRIWWKTQKRLEPLEPIPADSSSKISVPKLDSPPIFPSPPSTLPHVRVGVISSKPTTDDSLNNTEETFSTMSELTGTFHNNIKLTRQYESFCESLGNESIRDIRKALKEMEKQIASASTHGQRVSRERVMRALFTVADSLEDDIEREYLRNELHDISRKERQRRYNTTRGGGRLMMVTASFDDDQSQSRNPTIWEEEDIASAFVEDDFDDDDKSKISSVLDDLAWTEFVNDRSSATGSSSKGSRKSAKSKNRHRHRHRKEAASYTCDDDQSRSWWRRETSISNNKHTHDDDQKFCKTKVNDGPFPKSIAIKKNRRNKTTIRL